MLKLEGRCEVCGNIFFWKQRTKHRKFCSHKCYWKSKMQVGSIIPLACTECGKIFDAKRSDIRRGRKFCSRACLGKDAEKRLAYLTTEFRCFVCGKMFKRAPSNLRKNKNPFCSTSCYYVWKKGKNLKPIVPKISSLCLTCGKEILATKWVRGQGKGKFCSKKCADKWHIGKKMKDLLSPERYAEYSRKAREHFIQLIRQGKMPKSANTKPEVNYHGLKPVAS